MNVHAIVLEIPLTVANGGTAPTAGRRQRGADRRRVGVREPPQGRPSRRRSGGDAHFGPWIQVSRLGLPLINEAVIGLQDKDYWNHLTPADDLTTFARVLPQPDPRARRARPSASTPRRPARDACTTTAATDAESNRMDIVSVINLAQRGAASRPSATSSASTSARRRASRTAAS